MTDINIGESAIYGEYEVFVTDIRYRDGIRVADLRRTISGPRGGHGEEFITYREIPLKLLRKISA